MLSDSAAGQQQADMQWFDLREKLKHNEFNRKSDINTVARFLKEGLPHSNISQTRELKKRSLRKSKTSLHVSAEEPTSEGTTNITLHPSANLSTNRMNNFHCLSLATMNKSLARCLKKNT
jgi:hypothetical protein